MKAWDLVYFVFKVLDLDYYKGFGSTIDAVQCLIFNLGYRIQDSEFSIGDLLKYILFQVRDAWCRVWGLRWQTFGLTLQLEHKI